MYSITFAVSAEFDMNSKSQVIALGPWDVHIFTTAPKRPLPEPRARSLITSKRGRNGKGLKIRGSFTLISGLIRLYPLAGSYPDLLVLPKPAPLSLCFMHDGTRRTARSAAAYDSDCVRSLASCRIIRLFFFCSIFFFTYLLNRNALRMILFVSRARSPEDVLG